MPRQVLEPRFGAEVFASILSIAPSKTLLRRHLNTHFVTLIGNDTQHKKREVEAQVGNVPLTPNQKIKVSVRPVFSRGSDSCPTAGKTLPISQFQLRKRLFGHKRTRSDPELDDLIAPVANGQSNGTVNRDQKQVGVSTKACCVSYPQEEAAFSGGCADLTGTDLISGKRTEF